jgi:tetratricopeptide (TPR) repeat protein
VKILFLSANPVDAQTQIRNDKEFRDIAESIRRSPYSDQLEIVSEWAVRTGDMQAALLKHKPDIVHFSGHGSPKGDILLEDEDGSRKAVNKEAVSEMFRMMKHNIRLVVFNACYAKGQAEALTDTVDFTIGMSDAIEDRAAEIFAPRFYEWLALGYSLKEAFDFSINQLAMEGVPDGQAPELMKREGADSSEFRIVETHRRSEERKDELTPSAFLPPLYTCIAASFIIDVSRRFLQESGWFHIAALVAQVVFITLAILAAVLPIASLARPVRPLISRSFGALKTSRPAALLTAIALILALWLWLSLPTLARYYNEKGMGFQYQESPDLMRARQSYEQAVRLKPDYAQAHYNLATVYEDLHSEKAMGEYLLAINHDSNIYPAYNNLARLHILRGKEDDYERALGLLTRAAELSPQQDESAQYAINKNLGWANCELKRYSLAEVYLRKAISLRADAASAHCLLARALKAMGKGGAADEYFDCIRLAPGEKDVEPSWISEAQDYLMKGEGR